MGRLLYCAELVYSADHRHVLCLDSGHVVALSGWQLLFFIARYSQRHLSVHSGQCRRVNWLDKLMSSVSQYHVTFFHLCHVLQAFEFQWKCLFVHVLRINESFYDICMYVCAYALIR